MRELPAPAAAAAGSPETGAAARAGARPRRGGAARRRADRRRGRSARTARRASGQPCPRRDSGSARRGAPKAHRRPAGSRRPVPSVVGRTPREVDAGTQNRDHLAAQRDLVRHEGVVLGEVVEWLAHGFAGILQRRPAPPDDSSGAGCSVQDARARWRPTAAEVRRTSAGIRRGRDLNPRRTFQPVRDFQSRSLGRSDTSPRSRRVAPGVASQGGARRLPASCRSSDRATRPSRSGGPACARDCSSRPRRVRSRCACSSSGASRVAERRRTRTSRSKR